jgi:hypothetical protein
MGYLVKPYHPTSFKAWNSSVIRNKASSGLASLNDDTSSVICKYDHSAETSVLELGMRQRQLEYEAIV